jgi:hypothetical protein
MSKGPAVTGLRLPTEASRVVTGQPPCVSGV